MGMENYKPVGLGLIGCGGYCSSLAKSAKSSSKISLVSCFDVREEAVKSFEQSFGCAGTTSLEELLANPQVEAVIVASPNFVHRENVVAAAQAGKHIFVDKPIANEVSDAVDMIKAVKEKGVLLAVGHQGRRLGGHRKMKQMIEAGAVGTAITAEANFSHSGGLGLTPQQWRWYRDKCPALPLMQLGVHFADTVQYLMGPVTEVSSFMTHIATPAPNEDVTVSILKFASGPLGYLGSNYATPSIYYVNIYGTSGNLYCDHGGYVRYKAAGKNEIETIAPDASPDPQVEELEEFVECVRTGEKPEVDGIAGLRALAVVEAALKSWQSNRPVPIAELVDIDALAD